MSKEAMRLALEALKELVAQTETGLFAVRHDHVAMQDARQAITALREALAEPPTKAGELGAMKRDFWEGYVPEPVKPAQQHQDWCASVTQMLASMPPRPAPCDCKPAQQKPVTRVNLDMTGAMATLPKTGSESVVEYKPVDEHVCIYNECGFCEDPDCNVHGDADVQVTMPPMTNEGADANTPLSPQPKGTGKITLHESKPAQQEPVAHCEAGPEFCPVCNKELNPDPAIYPEEAYEMGLEKIAFYTSPPAQRTWVGLTSKEVMDVTRKEGHELLDFIYEYGTASEGTEERVVAICKAIEAKLKEKNT